MLLCPLQFILLITIDDVQKKNGLSVKDYLDVYQKKMFAKYSEFFFSLFSAWLVRRS